jgi:hypothetical protein
VNTIRLDLCRFAGTIAFLALCASAPTLGTAQDQPHKPFVSPSEMPHKTKMRLVAQPSPNLTGRWDTVPFQMPINPVHAALMNTGKVFIISGSGNDPDNKNLQAAVWDPKTLLIKTFTISWDMFCSGMVILPDGRPFVLGGTLKYDPFLGETKTAIFDPLSETFVASPDMGANEGRWYPSGIVLGNGSVLVYSGFKNTLGTTGDSVTNFDVQIWDGTTWSPAGTAFPSLQLYPRQHLLPTGKIFESGSNQDSQMYDPATKAFAFVAKTIFTSNRDYGTSVLLPLTPENSFKPVVMIMGGSASMTTDTTELMDLSVTPLKWAPGPKMVQPRIQMNATILPNGKVLASGGSVKDEDVTTAVKQAEIYDPATRAFTPASTMDVPRVYHSNTMLLPDGTVASFGGNPMRKVYQPEIEIYSPPYLFNANGSLAKRPTITDVAPGELHYGQRFNIITPEAANIESVVLIRAGAVTHSFDMEQRLVGLNFAAVGGALQATAPANGNLAPPGYYLLFILSKEGVPSVAQFVHLQMSDQIRHGILAPQGFKIHEVDGGRQRALAAVAAEPPLGPLVNFIGNWTGLGFNTIFRPSKQAVSGSDNVLELNLTKESLVFSPSLGSIPNRGEVQPDIFLNGLPYLQTISDVTTPNQSIGIHFEPGIWLSVPPTTDPAVPAASLTRMASIPHGATILAQGTSGSSAGAPAIPPVDITPFLTGSNPPNKIIFPSQTASNQNTPRIPKVLPVPGTTVSVTDWQGMLSDPNSVIRNAIHGQTITNTVTISIATSPTSPLFGGGTQDIAFLIGKPNPNANAITVTATFWIETVHFNLPVPVMDAGSSVTLSPASGVRGLPMPQFAVQTNSAISAPKTTPVTYTQIQYSQTVMLVFNGLTWPHVSVATLVPATPIPISLP